MYACNGSQPNAYSGSTPQVSGLGMNHLFQDIPEATHAPAQNTEDLDRFEFQEISLIDYAFAQLQDNSSGSFTGFGNGAGALGNTTILDRSKQLPMCSGLTSHSEMSQMQYSVFSGKIMATLVQHVRSCLAVLHHKMTFSLDVFEKSLCVCLSFVDLSRRNISANMIVMTLLWLLTLLIRAAFLSPRTKSWLCRFGLLCNLWCHSLGSALFSVH